MKHLAIILTLLSTLTYAANTSFKLEKNSNNSVKATWDIADNEFIINNKVTFKTLENNQTLSADCPKGTPFNHEFFNQIFISKKQLTCNLDLPNNITLPIKVKSSAQICKINGGCMAPITKIAQINSDTEIKKNKSLFSSLLSNPFNSDEPLSADKAFKLLPPIINSNGVNLNWDIADQHYLYKHAFKFKIINNNNVTIDTTPLIPSGQLKQDKFFGDTYIFHNNVSIDVPINNSTDQEQSIKIEVSYQGCADKGICYPPTKKVVDILVAANFNSNVGQTSTKSTKFNLNNAENNLLDALKSGNILLVIFAFFGAGLLLAFTPCIFPMIPILSGIITGQDNISTKKAFVLSLIYVLSMALVYSAIGVFSGLIGESIQAWFQKSWVILLFGLIIFFMALSMFGLFNLQMPQYIQNKANDLSNQQKSGSLVGVAIMGMLSALIVGACSTPVLAVAIGYIGHTGNPVLGGFALFAMSLGMGLPLLIIGSYAGKFLPKQGEWMNLVKNVFGVLMLAVALYIIDPVFPTEIMMLLWATLLIGIAVFIGAFNNVTTTKTKLTKSLGLVLFAYGIIMLIGIATGKGKLLKPLNGLTSYQNGISAQQHIKFIKITNLSQLEQQLLIAKKNNQVTMLDFYADWCKSCLELEEFTFSDPKVIASLSKVVLIQADVTENSEASKELLEKFSVNGPPAILFFDKESNEIKNYRLNGFFKPEDFIKHSKSAYNFK